MRKKVFFQIVFVLVVVFPSTSLGQTVKEEQRYHVIIHYDASEDGNAIGHLLDPYLIRWKIASAIAYSTLRDFNLPKGTKVMAVIAVPDDNGNYQNIVFETLDDPKTLGQLTRALKNLADRRQKEIDFMKRYQQKLENESQSRLNYLIDLTNKALKIKPKGGLWNRSDAAIQIKDINKEADDLRNQYQQVLEAIDKIKKFLVDQKADMEKANDRGEITIRYVQGQHEDEVQTLLKELRQRGFEVVVRPQEEPLFITTHHWEKDIAAEVWFAQPALNQRSFIPYGGAGGLDVKVILGHLRKDYVKEYQDYLKTAVIDVEKGKTPKTKQFLDYMRQQEQRRKEKKAGGIGAKIEIKDNIFTVSPLENSPAQKAGLIEGDKILKVNGEAVGDFDQGELIDRIRGRIGTSVKITVQREDEAMLRNITIIREVVKPPSGTPPR